ncbi:putative mitochondrial mitochondrial RNA binding protein [Leptomonas pyrrhocoris]|uniref:Putative mitochondrial mitochondrial RNA binding protein n=1 Tax=Leptomonas pyrrhocoris TaxID=157538 RepID=A0A0M9FVB3_LEPPY|nr:putative mitochondrial mitochondrial RNA binding protein [Leptomonas pyrrhocoris]XP_015655065.1 putative mitochondrial mitochondrial RNA binding protein [Leptomonas pyrrhocoris]KPA76625.1 putative mitochondrial mitochondrial RNA binding protein [Leptomonas pyrrhocoris]KPA76626.1 putative mitochondrial mitochondrial RNA binding protein [Leptomonas pyrrhocoris]|eukprot:XP_015655064.1 putative mitochondrial mitochondrial RNA binding protein [Leptomonas pyrrhocoris]
MKSTASLRALHAFVRAPHYRSIPPSGPSGIIINRDVLNRQFRDFYKTLQHSTLVDKLHLMAERPGVESMRVADQLACVGPVLLGMPLTGMEHRATEFHDAMRYVRVAGGPTNVSPYLQDNDACRCHSGDIVVLPQGIAVGHGPRTNAATHQVLRDIFCAGSNSSGGEAAEEGVSFGASSFEVVTLEQEGDAPPLGDYFGFAGNNILLVWKDEHGLLAVDQLQQQLAKTNQQLKVVYLEPGCHFFTFYGVDLSVDVLVQKGFERSMDALAAEGLNPISVQWSEMDKLGVSMRSAVLPLKFFQSPSSSGGVLQRSRSRVGRWQSNQLAK